MIRKVRVLVAHRTTGTVMRRRRIATSIGTAPSVESDVPRIHGAANRSSVIMV
jgi:hypothetical protein